jgi:rhodanese-related sulfurtransferase
MKKIIFGLVLMLGMLFVGCSATDSSKNEVEAVYSKPHMVAAKDVDELLKRQDIGIIDTRTKKEFEERVLDERAILIEIRRRPELEDSLFWFEKRIKKLDKNKTWFLYCDSGNKSILGGEIMAKHGFSNIYELEGGLHAYDDYKKGNEESLEK